MTVKEKFDRELLVKICTENKLKKLSFFGSVLRDDFGAESDIDLLAEFEDFESIPDIIEYMRLIEKFSNLFHGRKVSLITQFSLKGEFGDTVLDTAEVVFEKRAA